MRQIPCLVQTCANVYTLFRVKNHALVSGIFPYRPYDEVHLRDLMVITLAGSQAIDGGSLAKFFTEISRGKVVLTRSCNNQVSDIKAV